MYAINDPYTGAWSVSESLPATSELTAIELDTLERQTRDIIAEVESEPDYAGVWVRVGAAYADDTEHYNALEPALDDVRGGRWNYAGAEPDTPCTITLYDPSESVDPYPNYLVIVPGDEPYLLPA